MGQFGMHPILDILIEKISYIFVLEILLFDGPRLIKQAGVNSWGRNSVIPGILRVFSQ